MRSVLRTLARSINRVLGSQGLRLEYLRNDFDDRPLDNYTQRRVASAIGASYQSWISDQKIFEVRESFDASDASAMFMQRWLETPFRGQRGGSRFNNLLWLHLIARSMKPDYIIDSGTFQGASAWGLSLGSPSSRVWSFDIDLAQLVLSAPGVVYCESDWTSLSLEFPSDATVLAYFDDHVDQVRRLTEAVSRRCTVALFDDDFPVTSFYRMAPGPGVLPKIEFALDDNLRDGQLLSWIFNGADYSFKIDRAYLDLGRSCIAATERLPDTSLVTGIHQTPYRIIALNSRSEST